MNRILPAVGVALMMTAAPLFPQATRRETPAQLKAGASVSLTAARQTALAAVPGSVVKASKLEREGGRLVYSFDLAIKGRSGIDEVLIDAKTGRQVGAVVHETPQMEAAEAKQERAEKKRVERPKGAKKPQS